MVIMEANPTNSLAKSANTAWFSVFSFPTNASVSVETRGKWFTDKIEPLLQNCCSGEILG